MVKRKIYYRFYVDVFTKRYCPEPDSHIRDNVKVVLDLSNYATKKEADYATDVNISDLAFKKGFIALKAEVDKLDFNKFGNILSSF